MKKYLTIFVISFLAIGIGTFILSILFILKYYLVDSTQLQKYVTYICLAILLLLFMFFVCFFVIYCVEKFEDKGSLCGIQKLIKYSEKRKEIEEEIGILTNELMNTDISDYININRLAIDGTGISNYNGAVNYQLFFEQFGIKGNDAVVKKGSCVFLTPFNTSGFRLADVCREALATMDINVRTTSNGVEKSDILMNIITIILQSEFVIANINGRNSNVYYELGIAHAIGKPTILIASAPTKTQKADEDILETIGFDIRQRNIVFYENEQDLSTGIVRQVGIIRGRK